MAKRKGLSKTVRFEVFKRDQFTCQYCGEKSPDVILVVDHIHPVAAGGDNELMNLLTACEGCNSGKSDRKLDDNSALVKQRAQLGALQERREQIEMMMQWQRGLIDLDGLALADVEKLWGELTSGQGFTDFGRAEIKKCIAKNGLLDTVEGMRKSVADYFRRNADPAKQQESAVKTFNMIARIASFAKVVRDKPYMRDVMYIRGILRNSYHYVSEFKAKELLEAAFVLGANADGLKDIAKSNRNWTGWESDMYALIEALRNEQGARQ